MADQQEVTTDKQAQLTNDLQSIRQQRKAILSQSTPQIKPEEPGMSLTGFGENILDDAGDLLKGLFINLPVAAYRGAKGLIEDPSSASNIQADQVLGSIKDSLIEPYQKHGLKVAYYRPLSTAVDALALWGVAAKGAGLAAKVSGSARGLEFARDMEALPGRIVSEGTNAVAKKFGIDLPARAEFLGEGKRIENSRKMVKILEDDERISKPLTALNPEERVEFDQIRKMGHQPTDPPISPKVAEALDSTESVVKSWQDELMQRGKLTPEIIEETKAKKFAAEAGVDVEEAKKLMATADRQPFYGPALQDAKAGSLEDLFSLPKEQKVGKPGFLKEFVTGAGAITDPAVYFPRAIRAFREYEYRMRLAERVAQNPKWARVVKAGESMAPGESLINETVPKEVRTGESLAKGQAGLKFTGETASDQKLLAEASNIAIKNDTIRRLLKWEYLKQPGGMVRVYDAIMGMFKVGATRYNPHWVTGNIIGDAIMSVLFGEQFKIAKQLRQHGLGPLESAARPSMIGETGRLGYKVEQALHIHGMLEKGGELAAAADDMGRMNIITPEVVRNMQKVGMAWDGTAASLAPIMESTKNFSEVSVKLQLMGEELARKSKNVAALDKEIASLHNKGVKMGLKGGDALEEIAQRIINLQEARGQVVRDLEEHLIKTGELQKRIPGLQQQMEILVPAISKGNYFFGEYNGLSGFEQQVLRRVIPFYSWAKAMNMLAFRLPFIAPIKTFMWNRFGTAMMSLVGDKELPEYAKGYLPVFAMEDGSMGWLRFESFSPFNSVKASSFGGVPIPGPLDLTKSNPIIGLIFKAAGGENTFQQTNIPYGAKMVNIHNGDVYQFTDQGTVKKVIPQDPMISSIVHMFPLTQFVEQVLTPYRASQHDWVGLPVPQFNPNGSYKYPREWWERLSTLAGMPLVKKDRDQMIRAQQYRVRQVVMTYKNAYNRATPEQQKYIREVLSDYQRGILKGVE